MIATISPTVGIAASVDASVSVRPAWVCKAGMRYAIPLTTHVVVRAARSEQASMRHRRRTDTASIVVISPHR